MSTFTVGIPTFNRPALLKESLSSALAQQFPRTQIIVTDNSDNDESETIVRSMSAKVRYVRNSHNIGAWKNFARVLELADSDYFSWLQDDDILFPRFIEDAMSVFDSHPEVDVYASYAAMGVDPRFPDDSVLYGPPFDIEWGGNTLIMDGTIVAPLCLWRTVAIPPAIAFRTSHLKSKMERWNFGCPIHLERIILADACAGRKIAIQPKIAAFHRCHASKYYESLLLPGAEARQWRMLLEFIGDLLKESRDDWQSEYKAFLMRASLTHRTNWLNQSNAWPDQKHWLSSFVIESLNESVPGKKSVIKNLLKRAARNFCPPIILNAIRRMTL